jgi:hypothetical protein
MQTLKFFLPLIFFAVYVSSRLVVDFCDPLCVIDNTWSGCLIHIFSIAWFPLLVWFGVAFLIFSVHITRIIIAKGFAP